MLHLAHGEGRERVVSKNTNELKIGSPGRFGIDVYTLGWPMGARILGHEDADPAVPSIYSSASSWVSEVSPAARNTLDFARIPRASKLLICGLFQKGRVLAQDEVAKGSKKMYTMFMAAP